MLDLGSEAEPSEALRAAKEAEWSDGVAPSQHLPEMVMTNIGYGKSPSIVFFSIENSDFQ